MIFLFHKTHKKREKFIDRFNAIIFPKILLACFECFAG